MTHDVTKEDIQALCAGFSIETTPKGALKIGDFRNYLPAQTEVFVTHLAGSEFSDTIRTCSELQAQNMSPVPHFALRNFHDEMAIRHALEDIQRQDIRKILLLAGALSQPRGKYDCVASFLKTGLLEKFSFDSVFFAGHPEGAPNIPAPLIAEAEALKQGYALNFPRHYELVTQFCFAAAPIAAWQQSLINRDIHFPMRLGIPGVASLQSLLKHAQNCGIGASMDFLLKNSRNLRQLVSPRKPDVLLCDLVRLQKAHTIQLARLHFYPLGGFEQTVQFLHAIAEGQFTLTATGFELE